MPPYIQVPVEERHVPKVYEFLARVERGEDPLTPPPGAEGDSQSPMDEPTPELTEELVTRMYTESQPRHQALMRLLADRQDSWLYSSELIEPLGLPNGKRSLAGMFGAFGRRTKHRYGGAKPWLFEWDEQRGEGKYRMEPQIATWVRAAAS